MSARKAKPPEPIADATVPKAVVNRLSLYLRELQRLIHKDQATTSSGELGRVLGFTDAQVRKDLAYFGQFGYPGIGYRCQELVDAIRGILGTDREWPVALIGVGNLGRALLGYKGFKRQGFCLQVAFDSDRSLVGQTIEGIPVFHMDQLPEIAKKNTIKLAVVAVPSHAAQQVADRIVAAGIEGILNFAPLTINLPDSVQHVGVDLAIELEQLSFSVANRDD